jgi:hypothetical protein
MEKQITMNLDKMELANIASALMDNIFKCQDKIDSTKNKLTIQANELKIVELKKILDKVESGYYS